MNRKVSSDKVKSDFIDYLVEKNLYDFTDPFAEDIDDIEAPNLLEVIDDKIKEIAVLRYASIKEKDEIKKLKEKVEVLSYMIFMRDREISELEEKIELLEIK